MARPEGTRVSAVQIGEVVGLTQPSLKPLDQSDGQKDGLAKHGGNFDLLDQNGHFAIPENPLTSAERRAWRASLDVGERLEFNALRSFILRLFGINSLPEIQTVLANPERKAERTVIANRILAERYGIRGSDAEIKEKIEGPEGFIATAIRERGKFVATLRKSGAFELTNEVAITDNVLDLSGKAFFSKSQRVRFEAGKILDGVDRAAEAERIDREDAEQRLSAPSNLVIRLPEGTREKVDPAVSALDAFFDLYFFRAVEPPSDTTVLLSKHAPDDFRCLSVVRLPARQAEIARFRRPRSGYLYTEIGERTFTHKGREIPIYTTIRKKDPEAIIRKGKRKGTSNIRKAVEDTIGVRAVLETVRDVDAFTERLLEACAEAGYSFVILELENTLTGRAYSAKNPGSSEKLRILHLLAKLGPWYTEFQIFDQPAFIDYGARDEVSHAEYEVRRLYENGVPQHDFPERIYHQPHDRIKASLISNIRREVRMGQHRNY